MNAIVQRATVLTLAAAAFWGGRQWWLYGDWMGAAALGASTAAYPALLAIEFGMARTNAARRRVGRLPRGTDWLQAWWSEVHHGSLVFFWRQAFRSHAIPDQLTCNGRRGVIFVHGLFCNRAFWLPWMQRAHTLGLPYMAINLEPVTASIDSYVPLLDAAIRRMTTATGRPPVLVCHSMGGLVARAWLAGSIDHKKAVVRIVTIATPHSGTWMARFGHGRNARQMRLSSTWLQSLQAREEVLPDGMFVCWGSLCDNTVFPHASAMLTGAEMHWRRNLGHVALAFDDQVISSSLAFA